MMFTLAVLILGARQTLAVPIVYHPVMSGYDVAVDGGLGSAAQPTFAVTGVATIGHITVEDSMRLPILNVSATMSQFGSGLQAGGHAVGLDIALFASFGLGMHRSTWGGVKRLYLPVAGALPLLVCASGKSVLELYATPVWNFERVQGPANPAWLHSWGSVGGGVFFEWQSGFGLQLGVGDFARKRDAT